MAVQWPLLIFSILLGASGGLAILLAVCELKGVFKELRFKLALIALVLLAVGGCASLLHMGHIERAMYILGNVGSGLSKELFVVGFLGVALIVYLAVVKKGAGASKAVGVVAAVLGAAAPLIAGASYMMASRPAWDSFLLPCMYLGTGIGLGFALGAALAWAKASDEEKALAGKLALLGAAVSAITVVLYVLWIALAPHPDASRSVMRVLAGDLAVLFWLAVVAVGIGGSLGTVVLARKKASQAAAMLWASAACLLVCNVAIRVIMYAVATSVERFIY